MEKNPEAGSRLGRYADVARLLWKYGRSDLVERAGIPAELRDDDHSRNGDEPEALELADDLEDLGPTFIKLGQILSTRADLLPPPYLEALTRLQDQVEPIPYADVERIVEEELGARLGKVFPRFDPEPLAAASLGQVHRAELREGREVAVKVQRPGIRARVREDLEALLKAARLLDRHTEWGRRYGVEALIDEFGTTLARELDYRAEASNLETLGERLAKYDLLQVPGPVHGLTTERVLTMDLIHGRKVTDIPAVALTEMDGEALTNQLFEAYLEQVLVDGRFHADPHPGNVFLTDDGRIALLDLGMMGNVPDSLRTDLLRMVVAIGEGKGGQVAEMALSMGERIEDVFDPESFRRHVEDLVQRHHGARVEEIEVGSVVLEVARLAGRDGVRVPRELTLLGKTLLNLDAVGRVLAPEFDPDAAIREKAAGLLANRMRKEASPGNLSAAALDTLGLVQRLPGRLDRMLEMVAGNEIEVSVDAIDERTLIVGFQKVANRITTGLVLAALIVGAALLMQVPTEFRILGYPGLAIVLFAVAACGGLALVGSILLHDREGGGPARRP